MQGSHSCYTPAPLPERPPGHPAAVRGSPRRSGTRVAAARGTRRRLGTPGTGPAARCPPTRSPRHLPARHTPCQGSGGRKFFIAHQKICCLLLFVRVSGGITAEHRPPRPRHWPAPLRGGRAGGCPYNAPPGPARPPPLPRTSLTTARRGADGGENTGGLKRRRRRGGSPLLRQQRPEPPRPPVKGAAATQPGPPAGTCRADTPRKRGGENRDPRTLPPPLTAAHGGARSFVCPPRPGTSVPSCRAPPRPLPAALGGGGGRRRDPRRRPLPPGGHMQRAGAAQAPSRPPGSPAGRF